MKDKLYDILKCRHNTDSQTIKNFYELGSCFVCQKNGVNVKWYNDYSNTYCDKCYYDLINFRLDNLENL